ncbi:MAG: diacylglycerol kinase [Chloroflexi bacterium]|nr:MAG: diacylglycerol kinase [Chloroflexota bacterium]
MGRVRVILNPYAGRGSAGKLREKLAAALARAGVDFELVATRGPGEATGLAAEARRAGVKTVVAAGGDGTVNEVLNGLAEATPEDETIGKLAILPIGSGNDLADMLGCPRDITQAVARIAAGRTRCIDVGKTRLISPSRHVVRYFDNNMGLGFEAQVTLESYRIHWGASALRYVMAALRSLRRYRVPQVEIRWETAGGQIEERRQRALLVSVGNSPRTGGVFFLTPDARLDDGLFDLGVVREVSRARILLLLPKTLRGAHRDEPVIELTRCRRLWFHCAEGVPVHLDGEVVMADVQTAEVEIQPGRLEIVV